MATQYQIEREIRQLDIYRIVARAYSQIASLRIQTTRDKVLQNREYLQQINEIFTEVLSSYYDKIRKIGKKTGTKGQLTFISHNGRNVAVLMSANSGMYGDLILRTFNEFLNHIRTNDVEVTILGKYGLALFEAEEPSRPFTYFDFPDVINPDPNLVRNITTHLVQYQEIRFFYPEFKNIVVQKPQTLTLSSGAPIGEKKEAKGSLYVFEPSMEAVLSFFESQIFSSLMEQTVQESQLAKFASRLLSMDEADKNIKTNLSKLKLERLKMLHLKMNRKQQDTINSIVWRQHG